ncbi:peptide ABC transporter substrate-binding protein [Bacillus sp. AFS055030]|uniref:peptide ABC transporter substrate-binding protein n=1 Tax=Bacillus sp. AFS055030 TaxID=2033507 RepID=UPI000BFBE551|nr:peptide ABC transporter substrate-binding protein [Bacillus sp. AFS055030]PGL70303.1 peptide ABC transporter substrate-binding protein [Bacillus sp. AFS055030]
MIFTKKKFVSISLLLTLALTGCGQQSNQTVSKSDDHTLHLMDTSDVVSLDSSLALDGPSLNALNSVMEGLYMPNEKGEYVPAAALSHKVSTDGKVYTFTLRDAKYSNGDPVTAKDFVFAMKRAIDPKTKAQFAYDLYDIENAKEINQGKLPVDKLGVTAIDDKTLQIKLERPIPYFIQLTSLPMFFPLNEKFVKEQGNKYGLEANTTLYNGPYVVSKWEHEAGFTMEKNPQYYDKKNVHVNKIDVKIMKETTTAVNLYETGELDQAIIDSNVIDRYKGNKELNKLAMPIVSYISFNQKNPFLSNQKMRKAIANGFNKEDISTTLLNDGSIPTDRIIPKGLVKNSKGVDFVSSTSHPSTVSLKEAKTLFKEALSELSKSEATISLLVSDNNTSRKIGEYLKSQLETNLKGLTVNIVVQPAQQKFELRQQGNYDLSLDTWGADYPDPTTYLELFTSKSALNVLNYQNAQYDQFVQKANTISLQNESERTQLLHNAEDLLLDDAAIAPVYQAGYVYLQKSNVKNIKVRPFVGYFYYKYAQKQ